MTTDGLRFVGLLCASTLLLLACHRPSDADARAALASFDAALEARDWQKAKDMFQPDAEVTVVRFQADPATGERLRGDDLVERQARASQGLPNYQRHNEEPRWVVDEKRSRVVATRKTRESLTLPNGSPGDVESEEVIEFAQTANGVRIASFHLTITRAPVL